MSNEHELAAARARRVAIDEAIASLAAERARLDQRIAELSPTIGDATLPCWQCESPQAAGVRHWLGSNQDPTVARSAGGLPLACCRIETFQPRPIVSRYA
jgi:hypothetical protein